MGDDLQRILATGGAGGVGRAPTQLASDAADRMVRGALGVALPGLPPPPSSMLPPAPSMLPPAPSDLSGQSAAPDDQMSLLLSLGGDRHWPCLAEIDLAASSQ